MRLCRPPLIALAVAVLGVAAAYHSSRPQLELVGPTNLAYYIIIISYYTFALLAAPTIVALTARSALLALTVGLTSLMFLGDTIWFRREYTVILIVGLIVLAWRWRFRDSVIEYILSGTPRFYISPVLAALSLALVFTYLIPLDQPYAQSYYWALVLLGAIVASRAARTPWLAFTTATLAASGVGSIFLLWAATFLPLPPPPCKGAPIGTLLAVEGEAAPTRLVVREGKSDRGLVCVEESPARVYAEKGTVIWAYGQNPSWLARLLAPRIAEHQEGRYLIIDLDAPGPQGLSMLNEHFEKPQGHIALGSLHPEESKTALTVLIDRMKHYDVVAISWCNPDTEFFHKVLAVLRGRVRVVVATTCTLPAGSLTPVKGRRTQAIVTRTGDPLELSASLRRVLGEEIGQGLARLISRDPKLAILLPYCNSLMGLVRLESAVRGEDSD